MKMKLIFTKVYFKLLVLSLVLSVILPLKTFAAGTAKLYFNGSNSITKGSNYKLGISIDPAGATITALYLEITYDTTKLSPITNTLSLTSGFPELTTENSVGSGRIILEGAGLSKNLTTNSEIASITFATTSTGSAVFTYEATTQVLDVDSNDVTGVKESKTVTINPISTGTGGGSTGGGTTGSGTSGGSTSGGSNSTGNTTNNQNTKVEPPVISSNNNQSENTLVAQDTTPPQIENIKIEALESNIKYNLSWTTNEESISVVEYGASKDALFISAGSGELTTNHKAILDVTAFKENEEFFLRITATDKSGNKNLSEILSNKSIGSIQKNPQLESSKKEDASKSITPLIIGSVGLFLVVILGLAAILIRKKRLHLSNNDQSLSPANLHTSLFDNVSMTNNINPKDNKAETPNVPFISNIKKDVLTNLNNSSQQKNETPLALPPEDNHQSAPDNKVTGNEKINTVNQQSNPNGSVPLPGQVITPSNSEEKNS